MFAFILILLMLFLVLGFGLGGLSVLYKNRKYLLRISVSDTYNTIIQFFGAQTEITNEQYWTFLNTIRKDSEEEFFKPII